MTFVSLLSPSNHFHCTRMTSLTTGPETRPSLLIRLRDTRDDQAWAEFTAIYEPVIYRMSKTRGLQDADAREVVQEVLMSVATAMERFDVSAAGSFRGSDHENHPQHGDRSLFSQRQTNGYRNASRCDGNRDSTPGRSCSF